MLIFKGLTGKRVGIEPDAITGLTEQDNGTTTIHTNSGNFHVTEFFDDIMEMLYAPAAENLSATDSETINTGGETE